MGPAKQAQPYRFRFAVTGGLVLLLSGMVWIRPALIRIAVDDAIPAGDDAYLWQIFCAVVGLLIFCVYSASAASLGLAFGLAYFLDDHNAFSSVKCEPSRLRPTVEQGGCNIS